MENLLKSKGYWHLIETGYKELEKGVILFEVLQKQYEELMLKDLKVGLATGLGQGRWGVPVLAPDGGIFSHPHGVPIPFELRESESVTLRERARERD